MSPVTSPKVSVVIPVYNGAQHLHKAIDSVLAQTYKNIEIVVVNDGSNDSGATVAVCRRYQNVIRYIEKTNGGVASALNAGIRAMQGAYFCWLSHDDQFTPLKTELQVSVAEDYGSEDLVLLGDWENVDEHGDHIEFKIHPRSDLSADPNSGHGWKCLLRGHMNGSTMMFHRSQFERHGLFDEKLKYTQDYDYWLRLLEDSYFLYLPCILTKRTIHHAQLTNAAVDADEDSIIWRKVLEQAPESARIWSRGSQSRFFQDMGERLERNKRHSAASWAKEQAQIMLSDSLVSVVIPLHAPLELCVDTVNNVLEQSYRRIEVLLVGPGSIVSRPECKSLVEQSNNIRMVECDNDDVVAAVHRGATLARGEYISFLLPGERYQQNKIELQVTAMQREGSTLSVTGFSNAPNQSQAKPQDNKPLLPLSTIMFHRTIGGTTESAVFIPKMLGRHKTMYLEPPLVTLPERTENQYPSMYGNDWLLGTSLFSAATYISDDVHYEELRKLFGVVVCA